MTLNKMVGISKYLRVCGDMFFLIFIFLCSVHNKKYNTKFKIFVYNLEKFECGMTV